MDSLRNKTVIITGGTRGIGNACCGAFAGAGVKLVIVYHQSNSDSLIEKLDAMKVEYITIKADIKQYDNCQSVIQKTLERFGELDIIINNAGVVQDKTLFMMKNEEWDLVLDTNLKGTYNMTKAAITTMMKNRKGCIVNISSISGTNGMAGQTNYSASKAGIIGFSKALAKEVAGFNIRVNTVCPGYIDTEMLHRLDNKDEIKESIPLKRWGTPSEVADLCLFLASDKAQYITGETIKIDGGLTI